MTLTVPVGREEFGLGRGEEVRLRLWCAYVGAVVWLLWGSSDLPLDRLLDGLWQDLVFVFLLAGY